MAIYLPTPNTPAPFSEKYGSTYFPILADLTVYALFSRVTTSAKAQLAGLVAGGGVLYIFARRTSPLIGLVGAGLYLAYKVAACIYLSQIESAKYLSIKDLKESEKKLHQTFELVYPRGVDATDPDFKNMFQRLVEHHKTAAHQRWNSHTILQETLSILVSAQGILFKTYYALESATEHLESDRPFQLQRMADLLQDPRFNPDGQFDKALAMLNRTYRFARSMSYHLTFPYLHNGGPGQPTWETCAPLTPQQLTIFIQGRGIQREMNSLYNTTHDSIGPFLTIVEPISPWNVKDEQLVPGDDPSNSTNLFKLWPDKPASK